MKYIIQIIQKISLGLIILVGLALPSISLANPISEMFPNNSSVNSQGEAIKNRQETKTELQQKQNQLLRDIDKLNIEIQDLERKELELQTKITSLNASIQNLAQVDPKSRDQEIINQRKTTEDNLKKELDQVNLELVEIQKQLTEKRGQLEANREAITKIDAQIQEVNQQLEAQKNEFFNTVLANLRRYLPYIIGFIISFIIYLFIKKLNQQYAPPAIKDLFSVGINIIYIIGIGLVLTYLFIGQFSNIFTILSLFSAALVVALQDFISSFFAWIFIRARNKFKEGDIIQIAGFSGSNHYSGRVKKIEAFRTLLFEREGTLEGEKIDKERVTGRIISIPNNMFLKQPVINATQDNKIVWQTLDLIITFESDWKQAKQILQKIIDKVYTPEYIKEHKITQAYVPQIYTSIADTGVRLSIWFPASVGSYRAMLQTLSENILLDFKKQDINLAFNTITVEMADKKAR
ncbi:MAG: mechanosensitive ion channel domain-containing protein [Minisyncoccia bacterium]